MLIRTVMVALRRPYTFVVMALLVLIVGPLTAAKTPTDIFPQIRIPVIAVAWQYTGLPPDQMAGRISTVFQRLLTASVNDIEHIESNTYPGVGVVKIFFQPGVDIAVANAQITAASQVALRQMPAGIQPPVILNYNAATVPILQLALSGDGLSEQQLFDLGMNTVRTPLITVPGVVIPLPYGGKQRQVQIDLDPQALQARGLSAQDVSAALAAHNILVPIGTQKIGELEYTLQLNGAPSAIDDLGRLPVKVVDGSTIYLRDVADVHDGNAPQTNIVHVDGSRSVLMSVLKNGSASTLAIVDGIRAQIEAIKPGWPEALEVQPINDQSLFVRAAVKGVVVEGAIAAALTSVMILLFLGSWRSTVIIAVSIPLAILGSLIILAALGETLNLMTLGGLALAIGILVDDATVTIENVNWHLEQGKDVETAILDGARQIVMPAFVSLLCICIAFVPMFFLEGVSRYLFVPMAQAVIFAMICSFVLSRTLVPTMAKYLLKPHLGHAPLQPPRNPLVRLQQGFERRFDRLRLRYQGVLETALRRRKAFLLGFMAVVTLSFGLVPFIGSNFFPSVDSGQVLMHVRVPVGTRVEETASRFAEIEQAIRSVIPAEEITTLVDNIGLPPSNINLTYNNTGVMGAQDGDFQIALRPGHRPTADYVRKLRAVLPDRFPDSTFSFPPADIVSQILNFGAPAPIDIQIRGNNSEANFAYAQQLLKRVRMVPGLADARILQSNKAPIFNVDLDRTQAQLLGLTTRDVTNSLVVNLAGSSQVAPTYWLNPANGVSYPIVLQTPQAKLDSLAALANLPVGNGSVANVTTLGAVAGFERTTGSGMVSQYNVQPMVQIHAATQDRDLGAVAKDIRQIIEQMAAQVPRGSTVTLMGQVQTMERAFSGLLYGLLGAVVLIYLLIVVNFQSWIDPAVIVSGLSAALAGIVWMLFATGTTLSVPALTGAIMCMGVATANSVLVISFARERLEALGDATAAALEAGISRLRPVLMTALAMILGMLPMALGIGEGGEQNAPLGRAVIGGLLFATVATLLFVPVLFSLAHRHDLRTAPSQHAVAGHSDMAVKKTVASSPASRWMWIAGAGAVATGVVIIVAGLLSRHSQADQLEQVAERKRVATVAIVAPSPIIPASLQLPGRIEAWSRTPLYARVSGYLKGWHQDIGAQVKAGQLLAEIDAPDLDQQLRQARAQLATSRSEMALAATTAHRWEQLRESEAVSRQDVEERLGDLATRKSQVNEAQANVDRLQALQRYTRIVAPFDGVVTARNTDVGALINVGMTSGSELFVVSDVSRLRVYVSVPQRQLAWVRVGTRAKLSVPERPGETFDAAVLSMARAVDVGSGAMRVQLSVDNPAGNLLAGSFAVVRFEGNASPTTLSLPPSAVIIGKNGVQVATVDGTGVVQLKKVTVSRDHGVYLELADGVDTADQVIANPPDGLSTGDQVRIAQPQVTAATP